MLAETRAEVVIADQKASLTLAGLGIGFGALIGSLLGHEWEPAELTVAGQALWWAGIACAALSVFCAALAVWPRYVRADVSNGIHYWGHVATFKTLEAFDQAVGDHPISSPLRTRHQLYRLARLVHRKYTLIRCALGVALAGAALLLLASLIGG